MPCYILINLPCCDSPGFFSRVKNSNNNNDKYTTLSLEIIFKELEEPATLLITLVE